MTNTVINQKKIFRALKKADIQDPGLSELLAQTETTYKEIKEFIEDPDNEIPEEDMTLFLELEQKYEPKTTKSSHPLAKAPMPKVQEPDSSEEPKAIPKKTKCYFL